MKNSEYTREDFKGCEECRVKGRMRGLSSSIDGICCAVLKVPHFHDGTPNRYRRCIIMKNVIKWWNDMTLSELQHESMVEIFLVNWVLADKQRKNFHTEKVL